MILVVEKIFDHEELVEVLVFEKDLAQSPKQGLFYISALVFRALREGKIFYVETYSTPLDRRAENELTKVLREFYGDQVIIRFN